MFGGGIEEGESPEDAVKREAAEELGYELTTPRLFTVCRIPEQGGEVVLNVFVQRYDGAVLTLGEGQAMGWFRLEATKDLLMADYDRAILSLLAEELNANAEDFRS